MTKLFTTELRGESAATPPNLPTNAQWQFGWVVVSVGLLVVFLVYGVRQLRHRLVRNHRRQLERLVYERTSQLERADAAKTTYFAHLSHEIRNPINGILGASLALETENLPSEQREYARTVRACAMLLSGLVDDVLDFTRIEAGAIDLRHEIYDPRAMLSAVTRILSGQANTAVVTLSITVAPDVPELVMGDAARVQQIVVNFTLNAIKFAAGQPVELTLETSGGSLMFGVADRGRGIPDAEKSQLFASFSRLKAARQAGIPGVGLGLAVSRSLAEHMGGTVGVRDRAEGGSIFWLRLLLERPLQGNSLDEKAAAEFAGAHALIVEDLDYNATALEFVLRRFGFICDRARTAEEGLGKLRARFYDAVFVDCDLPGKSGIDFVCAAKVSARGGRWPLFIATSADATPIVRQACLDAGVDAFVSKPITPERLRHALRAFSAPARGGMSVQLPPAEPAEIVDYLGGGTEAGRLESRSRFAAAVQQSVEHMSEAQQARDRDRVRRSAHHLLALSRMVGSKELAVAAEHLETGALYAMDTDLAVLTGEVSAQARKVTASLRNPATLPVSA